MNIEQRVGNTLDQVVVLTLERHWVETNLGSNGTVVDVDRAELSGDHVGSGLRWRLESLRQAAVHDLGRLLEKEAEQRPGLQAEIDRGLPGLLAAKEAGLYIDFHNDAIGWWAIAQALGPADSAAEVLSPDEIACAAAHREILTEAATVVDDCKLTVLAALERAEAAKLKPEGLREFARGRSVSFRWSGRLEIAHFDRFGQTAPPTGIAEKLRDELQKPEVQADPNYWSYVAMDVLRVFPGVEPTRLCDGMADVMRSVATALTEGKTATIDLEQLAEFIIDATQGKGPAGLDPNSIPQASTAMVTHNGRPPASPDLGR